MITENVARASFDYLCYFRALLQWSVFYSIYLFSVRTLIFTCMSRSVIFSNM